MRQLFEQLSKWNRVFDAEVLVTARSNFLQVTVKKKTEVVVADIPAECILTYSADRKSYLRSLTRTVNTAFLQKRSQKIATTPSLANYLIQKDRNAFPPQMIITDVKYGS